MTRIRSSLPILIGGVALVAALALRTEPRPQAKFRVARGVEKAPPENRAAEEPESRGSGPAPLAPSPVFRIPDSPAPECGSAPVAVLPVLDPAEAADQGFLEEASSTFCTVSR